VETLLRALLIYTMPVERFLLLSPFVSYGLMSLMLLLTWRGRPLRPHTTAMVG
jgi:hypothetical protein